MSTITSLLNFNFGGIRRKDARFDEATITCSDCQNVELYYTELNSGVGIRTTFGNKAICDLFPIGEEIVGMFESYHLGNNYMFIYTKDNAQGRLYVYDVIQEDLQLILSGLTPTDACAGVDFSQGWLDMFIFSNGVEIKYIYSDTTTGQKFIVESDSKIKLIDADGRQVKGVGLAVFDSRLWVFNEKVLWYSKKGECRDFQFHSSDVVTTAGYIEFVKNITAIYPYLGSLAVFHKDSSCLVQIDQTTGFKQDEESPGGCAGYNSLVFHGTDLYFYDDTKKGVFSFQQIVNGDKTLGQNIANDIQSELLRIEPKDVNNIRALSVVTSDRNEVWFLMPFNETYTKTILVLNEFTNEYEERVIELPASIVMIFDYLRGEWVKRKCPKINAISTFDSVLYSGGKKLYQEYLTNYFDGDFIPAYYECTPFNNGSDNSLKITKFPPRITVNGAELNDFWVKYVKNYDLLKVPKKKRIKTKTVKNIMRYDTTDTYDTEYIYQPNAVLQILKIPSATFRAVQITFYTETKGQAFYIKNLEMTKLKVKQI